MATLKGQNFRILNIIEDEGRTSAEVFGMSTNCVVTLTNNVESSNTKDDVGLSDKPEVVSRAGSIQVETLNVADAAAFLEAVKTFKVFDLCWEETSTTDNQTIVPAAIGRRAKAICNDLTLTFNNRESSGKNVQLTLLEAPYYYDRATAQSILPLGSTTKGQYVRLFLGSDATAVPGKVISSAQQLSLHVSVAMESVSTKDTEGNWDRQEPTGLTYDITTNALMRSGETITSWVDGQAVADIEAIHAAGLPVNWEIANVTGANQRTKQTTIVSGKALLTQLTLNAGNRQTATYDAQLNGYGDYVVVAA